MTTTSTDIRTWHMHCSFIAINQGPLYTNFGTNPRQVAFNNTSRDAHTIAVRLVEDANGEYLGMIKNGVLDPASIRRFALSDPFAGTPSERLAAFDFDGTPVRLRAFKK